MKPSKEIPHSAIGLVNYYIPSVLPQHGGTMTKDEDNKVGMAECGSCRAVIPIDSTTCPECDTSFQGVSDEALGECGACKSLVPLDSSRCPDCGVLFVADDVVDVLRQWISNTGIDLRKLFDKFDENGDGMIDSSELRAGLLSLNLADLPPAQVDRLVMEIDEDDNGVIDLDEFIQILTAENEGHDHHSPEHSDDDSDAANEQSVDESTEEDSEPESAIDDEAVVENDEAHEEEFDAESNSDEHEFTHESLDDEDHDHDEMETEETLSPSDILRNLVDMMDDSGVSPQRVFNDLDKDGDGSITLNELTALLESDYGEDLDMVAIEALMSNFDDDGDGSIDIAEFYESIESIDDGEAEEDEEIDYFPTPMQKRMMSKQWNDAVWPILHTGFVLFFILLLVNALVGPVDGTGGMVAYEPMDNGLIKAGVEAGEIYACDESYQNGGCSNSLTPFSGDSSSMPKGFYLDGILFMVFSMVGLGWSLFMHFVRVPAWRARARAMKDFDTDKADAASSDADGSDEKELVEIEDSTTDDEEDVLEDIDPDDEGAEDDTQEDDDAEESDDGEIDIGSHIGLEFDGEEVFGVIVEFDDEEGTVTIEEDDSGDIITGYQDDMFVE